MALSFTSAFFKLSIDSCRESPVVSNFLMLCRIQRKSLWIYAIEHWMHFGIHGLIACILIVLAECRFIWNLLLQYLSKNERKFRTWSLYHGISAATIALHKSWFQILVAFGPEVLGFWNTATFFFKLFKSTLAVLFQLQLHRAYYFLVTHLTNYSFAIGCKGDMWPPMIPILMQGEAAGAITKAANCQIHIHTLALYAYCWNLTTAYKELNFILQNLVE
jgi:hypothetical protein